MREDRRTVHTPGPDSLPASGPGRAEGSAPPPAPGPGGSTDPVHNSSSLTWDDGAVVVVDQRALPHEYRLLRLETVDQLIDAIGSLAVRGAPAIGLAGALGVALSARLHQDGDGRVDEDAVRRDSAAIAAARPTAVNLAWAVRRALARLGEGPEAVLAEARSMLAQDAAVNRAAVRHAADLVSALVPDRPLRILTHCNTGRLATAAVGTALGTILELAERGRVAEVLVGETRPLLQGARLTTWELGRAGVPHRLCVDAAAAAAMSRGMVDCVLVGADRIAANGDTANKIGTYGLAVSATRHRIPFVVIAPESSWDRDLADGSGIVVEERPAAEVTGFASRAVAPAHAAVFNPAFDITPGALITAVVSEDGVFRPDADGPAVRTPHGGGVTEPGAPAAALASGAPTPVPDGDAPVRKELACRTASFARALYERGWMPGTSGNLSVRLPGPSGHALITASGRDKGELTEHDLVTVDAATGEPVGKGTLRASAETAIHASVYRTTGAGAVIHVHAPYATAVASRVSTDRVTALRLERFELLKGLGLADPAATDLPVFPNWSEVPRIAEDVSRYLGSTPQAPPGLLIADHGITAWGSDLAQARNRLECLESICRLLLLGARPAPDTAPATDAVDTTERKSR
ncbi:S-methyl-5-thioribose-1-phosphate isomerase [Streptomyces sp. NPDC002055]|uniref:S-methyl-5-thioribose-1-phosphate isomerase n=1 Tax=Streptomyces sp. NPDC002055 TaxID=3154534 RepID=UPI0033199999